MLLNYTAWLLRCSYSPVLPYLKLVPVWSSQGHIIGPKWYGLHQITVCPNLCTPISEPFYLWQARKLRYIQYPGQKSNSTPITSVIIDIMLQYTSGDRGREGEPIRFSLFWAPTDNYLSDGPSYIFKCQQITYLDRQWS